MSKSYAERKEMARQEAIDWQMNFPENNYSLVDMVYFSDRFTKLGKRYGLIREFRENGII